VLGWIQKECPYSLTGGSVYCPENSFEAYVSVQICVICVRAVSTFVGNIFRPNPRPRRPQHLQCSFRPICSLLLILFFNFLMTKLRHSHIRKCVSLDRSWISSLRLTARVLLAYAYRSLYEATQLVESVQQVDQSGSRQRRRQNKRHLYVTLRLTLTTAVS